MRILHILSQRPGLSGSGVFFNALVHEGRECGIEQHAIVAGPSETNCHEVPGLTPEQFSLIPFPSRQAPFPVPGNSDLMPYPSSVFSSMTATQIEQYLAVGRRAMERARDSFRPDVVHSHHLWLMTALARRVFPATPVVATAHNSELRQLIKAPHLASRVLPGIRALDRIGVLTPRSKSDTVEAFGVKPETILITGAGYRPDLFHPPDRPREALLEELRNQHGIHIPDGRRDFPLRLVTFAGRLSSPKGIPYLLDAFRSVQKNFDAEVRLILVGEASPSQDGRRLQQRALEAWPSVVALGGIPHQAVAKILQASDLFVLPSLFEGLPLVMLEALATGLPCVLSALPTIQSWVPEDWARDGQVRFVPALATTLADCPVESDVKRFVDDLAITILDALKSATEPEGRTRWSERLREHTWAAVFARYLESYRSLGVH